MGTGPGEAIVRFTRMLPAPNKAAAAKTILSAYLRLLAQGRAMQVRDASETIRSAAGTIEIEKCCWTEDALKNP